MARMRAGRMRHVIEVQQRIDTTNSLGEQVPSWQTVREVRAAVDPMDGEEVFRSDATLSNHPVHFVVRYDETWEPMTTDRIVWRDDNYDIKSVVDADGRKRTRRIMAVRHD